MITLATRQDIPAIVEVLIEFMRETAYAEHTQEPNRAYLQRLVFNVIYAGYIWLWQEQEEIVGLLAAVKEPNVWMPNRTQLRELVWYVKPDHRGRATGGKLFVEFSKTGDALLREGKVHGVATTRMTTTADYNLERRGFRLTELMYVKD